MRMKLPVAGRLANGMPWPFRGHFNSISWLFERLLRMIPSDIQRQIRCRLRQIIEPKARSAVVFVPIISSCGFLSSNGRLLLTPKRIASGRWSRCSLGSRVSARSIRRSYPLHTYQATRAQYPCGNRYRSCPLQNLPGAPCGPDAPVRHNPSN